MINASTLFPESTRRFLAPDPDEPDPVCELCGRETAEVDSLGRCPEPLCALASRIDEEVPLRTLAATLRLSRLAFAARAARLTVAA